MTGYSGYDDDSLVIRTDANSGDQIYNYEQNDEVLERAIKNAMNEAGFLNLAQ